MENVQLAESKDIKVQTVRKKRRMHQSITEVGILCEEPHDMVNLGISVEDDMCAVKSDTEWLTAQSNVTKFILQAILQMQIKSMYLWQIY